MTKPFLVNKYTTLKFYFWNKYVNLVLVFYFHFSYFPILNALKLLPHVLITYVNFPLLLTAPLCIWSIFRRGEKTLLKFLCSTFHPIFSAGFQYYFPTYQHYTCVDKMILLLHIIKLSHVHTFYKKHYHYTLLFKIAQQNHIQLGTQTFSIRGKHMFVCKCGYIIHFLWPSLGSSSYTYYGTYDSHTVWLISFYLLLESRLRTFTWTERCIILVGLNCNNHLYCIDTYSMHIICVHVYHTNIHVWKNKL